MNVHSDKKENNQYAASNSGSEAAKSKSTFQFKDNRPQSVLQKKLVDGLANKSNANLIQKKTNSTGLPDQLKTGIENLSGHSMDDVKVHYNSSQPAQLNAHAYAKGRDIHIASGQEKHLPHEAWHVVQQKQGRVKPTMQMKGKVNINDDTGLEKEADLMGAKALQMKTGMGMLKSLGVSGNEIVQRVIVVPRLELDAGLIMDIWQILRNGQDSGVTLLELLNLEDHNGEALNMMGHGPVYAEIEAAALAERFREAGLQPNLAVINLLSCDSGAGDADSYVARLSESLGQIVTVTGYRGSGITLADGVSHSTREPTEAEDTRYNEIIAGGAAELAAANAIAERIKAELADAHTQADVTGIITAGGAEINAIVGELFNQLYEFQQGMIVSREEGVFEIAAAEPVAAGDVAEPEPAGHVVEPEV